MLKLDQYHGDKVSIMAQLLNIQERIFIVETMAQMKSKIETWKRFKRKFGHGGNVKTTDATVKKWKEVGTVQDQFKDNAGRKKSARTPENQAKIISLVASNNKTSVRRLAIAAGTNKSSIHNILRKDLLLTPHRPQVSQNLKEGDDIKKLAS